MADWITWGRDGDPPVRIELPAEVAEAIERYAVEIGTAPAEVVASIIRSTAAELGNPFDGEGQAAIVRALFTRGPVLITFRPQALGVDVPDFLKDSPVVSLRFGYGLQPAISDLEVDARGVRGTLTFSGAPHHCVIPWRAVLVAQVEGGGAPEPAPPTHERPKLRLV